VQVIEESLTAAPPEVKVTTGVLMDSLAVIVNVITSLAFAKVLVLLEDEILTALKVGAVVSTADTIAISSI
jgi:hypothetical protein